MYSTLMNNSQDVKANSNIRVALLCVIMFMLIYNNSPIPGLASISTERIAVLLLLVFYCLFGRRLMVIEKRLFANKAVITLLLFQIFILLYSGLLILVLGGGSGETIIDSAVNFLLIVFAGYLFLPRLFKSMDEFMKAILIVSVLQSVVILVGMAIPAVGALIDSSPFNANSYWDYSMMRSRGYPGGLACITSQGTMQLAVGTVPCIYFMQKGIKTFRYVICLIFLSAVMTAVARTGIIIAAVIVLVILIELFILRKKQLFKTLLLIVVGVVLLYIVINITGLADRLPSFFSRLLSLKNSGLYEGFLKNYFSGSTTVIPPISWDTILGTGIVSGTSGNGVTVNADGGFIRTYVALGLPLAIVFYMLVYGLMIRSVKFVGSVEMKCIAGLMIAYMFIGEFKEYYVYTRYLTLVYYSFIYLCEKQNDRGRVPERAVE